MATYIDRTNDAINEIAGEFWNTVRNSYNMDKDIADELFKKGEDYKDVKLIERIKQEKIYALKVEAGKKIDTALDNLKAAYSDDKAKLDRTVLRATTGERIAEEYAQAHKISLDQARTELKEYAQAKSSGFGDGLPDRYAAIRNRGKDLNSEDTHKAHQYYNAELKAGGYYEKEALVKQAEYMTSNNGISALDQWNTSGAVLVRQLHQNK